VTKNTLRYAFFDLLVGIPAGFLIFMGMVLFSTLLRGALDSFPTFVRPWTVLVLLCVSALTVGLLAGLLRRDGGVSTALAAGLIAALILLLLWLNIRPGEAFNPLVFNPFGIILTVCLSTLGGWAGNRLRKKA
jgi:ABC-type amino acid transport system permease subunit